MSAFVTVERLSLAIDGHSILHKLSFTIAAGESVALTGPNGSGKTSILRCLLGLVPFQGRATIGGKDVVADAIAARTLCGYLPQKPAFGDARAHEVLAFVAQLRRIDRARIPQVLETVGLAAHASERVRTFSGGMQQRLSLAVALLADAPMLLLDEPTASLDGEGQRTFANLVGSLKRNGRTLLIASHRPEEIHTLADRVLALDAGELVDEQAGVVPLQPALGARR